ncbi:ARF GTPase-activating protein GIT2-like [Styela clava]
MMKSRTMPRNPVKSGIRPLSEICSDCGAPDANWASVNRGVLMCNDCASVHMTLGRHISQVKHLHKCTWHPNMLSMVQHLVSAGANSIWEHSLLDPAQMRSGKRKPNPNDNIHPTKSDFIKSKYLNLSYVHRLPLREDEHHDISKQLHSSVRTGNLETCLRLLSRGAQANFFSPERGNAPLHVASKVGQSLQVELLVAYGADPAIRDSNGKTPEDIARAENHNDLADRLVELQHELSDRFTEFVCSQTPDHKAGKHYLLPKIKDACVISPEGKRRLRALNNQTFGELAMDVYDEVDRRELERVWQEIQKGILFPGKGTNPALQTEVVPFLPVHPDYSTTRNQGRQKLAIFKEAEMNNLICDILHEVTRRQKIFDPIPPEEDPIYDIPPDEELNYFAIEKSIEPPKETVPKEEFLSIKAKLEEKNAECLRLTEQNRELSTKVTALAKQKIDLTRKIQTLLSNVPQLTQSAKSTPQAAHQSDFTALPRIGLQSPTARPSSVYNPNDSSGSTSSLHSTESSELRRRTIHVDHQGATGEDLQQSASPLVTKHDAVAAADSPSHCSNGSEYDNNSVAKDEAKSETTATSESKTTGKDAEPQQTNLNANNNLPQPTAPLAQPRPDLVSEDTAKASEPQEEAQEKTTQSNSSSPHSQVDAEEPIIWPERQALMKKTELLTRMIQTLLQTAQLKKVDSYLECAENILSAVSEVIALFDKPHLPAIKSVLSLICESAHKLRNRCKDTPPEHKSKADSHKHLTEEIIAYAYEVAKAEKQLVMMAPKEETEPSTSRAEA